ncbi:MAG: SDR family NAD(P)-dependent oxidoreductase [Trichloromonadaceae bacterium]
MKRDQNAAPEAVPVQQPLAIIGMGCLFPKADDLGAYWANIKQGVDAITEISPHHWRPEDYYDQDPKRPDMTYGRRGGFLNAVDFNPMDYGIPPNAIEAIDTSQLLGLVAAGAALRDAGYGSDREFDRERVSVLLGVTGALELVIPLGARLGHPKWRKAMLEAGIPEAAADDAVQRISDSYVGWQENSFPGLLGNVVAGRITKQFDLGGTNSVIDAACGSSLSALHVAAMELATGRADMVVTGGVDTFNDIFMYMCFSKTPALSPTGNSKPFDASGDGTVLGEGLGMVILKRLADAERDGDRIYALIRAIGSSSDGKGEAIYAPSAEGQVKALRQAYRLAGVDPKSVDLVEAHGTGTKVGDAVEVRALRQVYGDTSGQPWCALGSVKSQIGHTKAAAGAAGLIKAALALHHKVLPPTIKVNKPLDVVAESGSPFYVNAGKRPWLSRPGQPRRAAVSALGFGGSNFHSVLEEYQGEKTTVDWDGEVQILAFAADNRTALSALLDQVPATVKWDELRRLAARTRGDFSAQAPCRLLLVVEQDRSDLPAQVKSAKAQLLKEPPSPSWSTPDGAFYASGQTPGKLGVLFPGQGAQYPGMLRDLVCQFRQALAVLEQANQACGEQAQDASRLSDLIFPPASFDSVAAAANEAALRSTDVAQPAIGAVSLGAWRVLQDFGVTAAAVAGHSYGELTALCAADRFDAATLHRISQVRGRLMAGDGGDRGTMLAVSAPLAQVEEIISAEGLDLVLANRNAPTQAVLSGSRSEIARAAEILSKRGLQAKEIPVAAAFHSPLVAEASTPFLEALQQVSFAEGSMPVFANTTAGAYPAEAAAARKLLAEQLAKPVEFVRQIEAMHAAGVTTFLEVGPGARLTGLVKAILGDRPFQALALDASNGKRSGIADLARSLAQLAALGHKLQLTNWDADFAAQPEAPARKKPMMTVPLSGANYVKPKAQRAASAPIQINLAPVAPPQTAQPVQSALRPAGPAALAPIPATTPAVAEALRMTQENMAALQRLQEQTALLHRQFLDGQEVASRTFQTLLEQQQLLLGGGGALPRAEVAAEVRAHDGNYGRSENYEKSEGQDSHKPQAPAAKVGQIAQVLLEVIAEKTGYPVEMLELDMGLDSDLGIDSIKRVEILSALQEKLPEAPAIRPEQLGSLQTLRQIVEHLGASLPTASALPVAAADAVSKADSGQVAQVLLEVIAEKTGYPVEMLELDMGLDSDLGIDSIKRVEILSALQEKLPEAPAIRPEQLGSLQTLRQIVEHLGASLPDAPASPPSPKTDSGQIAQVLLEVIAEKTGYPVEMLELDMGLDSDLGIDSIKRVEILSALQEKLPEAPAIRPEQLGSLQTLRQIVEQLTATSVAQPLAAAAVISAPEGTAATLASPAQVSRQVLSAVAFTDANRQRLTLAADADIWLLADQSPLAKSLAQGLQQRGARIKTLTIGDIASLSAPQRLAGLIIAAPEAGSSDDFLKQAFVLLQLAGPALRAAGKTQGAFFASIGRLDGAFGLQAGGHLADPVSGGLAGLSKTAGQEWPEVNCKAFDLAADTDHQAAADSLIEELFLVGPAEVGISTAGRKTLQLSETPLTQSGAKPFQPGEVVVITGGARGVTAETALALAHDCQPTLVLLGRSAEPEAEAAWLAPLQTEAEIKQALLTQAGQGLKPKEIAKQCQAILTARELRSNLARIGAAGGQVIYRALDVRDPQAVALTLAEIRREFGPIRGLIHGAGVLADRRIEDKTAEQFAAVYDTKIAGLRALLAALPAEELRVLALFSSSTGRFGRTGQIDYAVANEVLNKMGQDFARRNGSCRVVSLNWGPWDGGMVTSALKKIFEQEGVAVIDLQAGARYLVEEIATPAGGPVELVILGGTGNSDIKAKETVALSMAFEIKLNVKEYPFLKAHVLDGKAVLPTAMIIEWLANGALNTNPGLRFHGFDQLRILKGVTLDSGSTRSLQVRTGKAVKQEGLHRVPAELTGVDQAGRPLVHARADIVLTVKLPTGHSTLSRPTLTPLPFAAADVYSPERLFHGPAFQGISALAGAGPEGIVATLRPAPAPGQWITAPLRGGWIADPLVLDGAFQMMILWSEQQRGAASLPCFAGRYRQFREAFSKGNVEVVARVTKEKQQGALADVEFLDAATGELIARLEDYECVIDPSLSRAFANNRLAETVSLEMGAA